MLKDISTKNSAQNFSTPRLIQHRLKLWWEMELWKIQEGNLYFLENYFVIYEKLLLLYYS